MILRLLVALVALHRIRAAVALEVVLQNWVAALQTLVEVLAGAPNKALPPRSREACLASDQARAPCRS